MADQGQRVHGLAADEHVELHQIAFAISREVVIERSVAARHALQAIVEIEDDLVERHFVGEHHALGRQILESLLHAALFLAELQDRAHRFIGGDDHGGDHRLLDLDGHSRRREISWGCPPPDDLAVGGGDAIAHAGRGGDQVDAEFALEALLHDFHVQQAEEAAAKTEAQRDGIFRLVEKCGVVELQLAQRVAQRFVFVAIAREKAPRRPSA